jgi:hypothetical protein
VQSNDACEFVGETGTLGRVLSNVEAQPDLFSERVGSVFLGSAPESLSESII